MSEAVATIRGRKLDGRYTLLDKLGAGGQGEVWRAADGTRGIDIAVKVVDPARREEEAWRALEHEYSIASKLDHPSILKVFPPERIADVMILPMELAAGGDLRRLRGAGFLEIIPVLLEIAQALEHAHERGVVHRDLKPSNVLFDIRGRARLADFGVAEQALASVEPSNVAAATATRDTNRHGFSPFTASPAQLRGEPPTPADDIYGLGALAYELLSGYPPYYPTFEKRRAIEEPVPALVPTRQIPPLLRALVTNMLAKDPKKRPRTMREVIDELDAALNDTLTFDFESVSTSSAQPAAPNTGNSQSSPQSGSSAAADKRAIGGAPANTGGAASAGAPTNTGAGAGAGASPPNTGSPPKPTIWTPESGEPARPSIWTPASGERRTSAERRGRRRDDFASNTTGPGPNITAGAPGSRKLPTAPDPDATLILRVEELGIVDPNPTGGSADGADERAPAAVQSNTTGAADPNATTGFRPPEPTSAADPNATVGFRGDSKGASDLNATVAFREDSPPAADPNATIGFGSPSRNPVDPNATIAFSPDTVGAPPSSGAGNGSRPRQPHSPMTPEEAAAIVAAARAASAKQTAARPTPTPPSRQTSGYSAFSPPTAPRSPSPPAATDATLIRGPAPAESPPVTRSRPWAPLTTTTTHLLPPDSPPVPTSDVQSLTSYAAAILPPRAADTAPTAHAPSGAARRAQPSDSFAPVQPGVRQQPARATPGTSAQSRPTDTYAQPQETGTHAQPHATGTYAQPHATGTYALTQPIHNLPMHVDGAPMHATWDIPLDGLPKVARLQPIHPRRWPWVFLGLAAGAAAAMFFWLPRFDTSELPPDVAAVVTPLKEALAPPRAQETAGPSAANASGGTTPAAGSTTSTETLTPPNTAATSAPPASSTSSSPGVDDQRLREMKRAFDSKLAALEARGAGVWGGREFALAKTRAAESVGAHDAGNARMAEERLTTATRLLDTVENKAPQAFAAQLGSGEKALSAGQQELAGQAFDLARRINPADRRAVDGQRRAQNLTAVLPLLADARNAEAAHDYARAAQDYSQALFLDPNNATARAGQSRANSAFGDDNYAKAVGSGFAALGAGRLDEAHDAFLKARALKPNGPEASEGLRRVSAALSARGFASMRQRAVGLEAEERWEEAERVYEDVLAADPSLAFAQEGKARTSSRADLSIRLQQLLDRPDRLSSPSVRDDARALVETARAQSPQGPVIRSQIARLEILLPSFDKPVRLSLLSDNSTQIVIPSIGSFGAFARRDIELRPGKYTVVGTRNGFRDVRREITVAPGQETQTIRVTCSDPI